jgi:hypothetical protein
MQISQPRDQVHPLYDRDRKIVDRLLEASTAGLPAADQDTVDLARLLIRYQAFPGARDISRDLVTAGKAFGFASRDAVMAAARAIWSNGYRPQATRADAEVGSGADVQMEIP